MVGAFAYTIVAARRPGSAPRAPVRRLDATDLHTLTLNGRLVVTWRRAARTRLLSVTDVPAAQLQQLAASMAA
jgi:hypothetical protein